MVILHTTEVVPLPNYSLFLCSNDGASGDTILANVLYGEVFGALREPSLRATARQHPVMRTVAWANGLDMAPEFFCALMQAQRQQQSA